MKHEGGCCFMSSIRLKMDNLSSERLRGGFIHFLSTTTGSTTTVCLLKSVFSC